MTRETDHLAIEESRRQLADLVPRLQAAANRLDPDPPDPDALLRDLERVRELTLAVHVHARMWSSAVWRLRETPEEPAAAVEEELPPAAAKSAPAAKTLQRSLW